MTREVWGTFSVRDHCAPNAFLRETLIFDRLLIPYPDPLVEGERARWTRPNPSQPHESWDPDRLDQLLDLLGTEDSDGYNGARFAQRSMWNPLTWDMIRSDLEMSDAATGDPWMDTRLGLRTRPETPAVVEAIAAYASEPAWRREQQPAVEPEADLSAAEALVQLPRPYLLPSADTNEFDALRQVIELAQDPEYVKARHRYFEWFRDFVEPLRTDDTTDLAEIHLDPSSLALAEQNLRKLFTEEQAVVRQGDRAKWFTRVEVACVSAGTTGSVGLALAAALPAVGIPVAILTFAGWALARHAKPQPPRSLGGATMFVDAQRQLDWPTAST